MPAETIDSFDRAPAKSQPRKKREKISEFERKKKNARR
jgi:hypothetical protein